MALNWNWKKKMGVITIEQRGIKHKVNLYKANCLGALIYEYKDQEQGNMYQFFGFWNDERHLQNCLGFNKKYGDNIHTDFKKAKLNTFFKDSLVIARNLVKANIKVELYYKEIKN